jgi:hypothetical protein
MILFITTAVKTSNPTRSSEAQTPPKLGTFEGKFTFEYGELPNHTKN